MLYIFSCILALFASKKISDDPKVNEILRQRIRRIDPK